MALLTKILTQAMEYLTISFIVLLILASVLCLLFSIYILDLMKKQRWSALRSFTNTWGIRIFLTILSILWAITELFRLKTVVGAFGLEWQSMVCKFYIISNLGVTEPCLLIGAAFVLQVAFQQFEPEFTWRNWNFKAAGFILLYDLILFIPLTIIVIFATGLNDQRTTLYFTDSVHVHKDRVTCQYPLSTTFLLGLFECFVILKIWNSSNTVLKMVLNVNSKKRIAFLVTFLTICYVGRLVAIGVSSVLVLLPNQLPSQALVYLAFSLMVFCIGQLMFIVVFNPLYEALAEVRSISQGNDAV